MEYRKLKKALIREEFVALTGSFEQAVILNQFLYWTERVKDFDNWIVEENIRRQNHGVGNNINPTSGWIYKTAEELNEEVMLQKSPATILKYLDNMVKNGWIMKRNNPLYKWDRTLQYRVDLNKLESDLLAIGYQLEGFKKIKKS